MALVKATTSTIWAGWQDPQERGALARFVPSVHANLAQDLVAARSARPRACAAVHGAEPERFGRTPPLSLADGDLRAIAEAD